MFRKTSAVLSLLVVLLACLGTLASPSYRTFTKRGLSTPRNADADTWSNAERLARGLSPRKPGTLYNPSRVQVARTVPSGSPQPLSGYIRIREASNNQNLGWIRQSLTSSGRFTQTTSTSGRLPVKFTPTSNAFLIEITDTANYKYLGFGGANGALTSNNGNRASILRSNSVATGSTPTNVATSMGFTGAETYVWSYDPSSTELTAQWINPNGAVTAVYFYYEDNGPNTGLHISASSNLPGFVRVRMYLA